LNLVCENKTDRNVFAENLKIFLEEHFDDDPEINGEVRLLQKLVFEKKLDKESYRAVPYVFVLEKQKDIDQLCDMFTDIGSAKKKRKNHPFKDSIPICISDHQILDSAVLNIMVPDVQKMSWDSKRFVMLTSSSDAIFRTYHMLKDKKSTRSWMKVVRREMQHMIGGYCASDGVSTLILANLAKYQPKMLELMTWFVLLWHGVGSEDSASDSEKIFVVSLIEDMIQQQNILNNIVDVLMNHFKKAFDGLPDGRPLADLVDKKYVPEEMVFRTKVKEDSLLCFYPDYFTEWLKEHDLNVRQDDVLEYLKARGLLTTDSDKPFLRGIKLKKRDPHLGKGNDLSVNHIAIKME
jgi:adenylate kinase family enzyme